MEASKRRQLTSAEHATTFAGVGQLSLVEHALCPLAVRQGAPASQIHDSHYRYTDAAGERLTARVRVICPLGLTPADEFFLWGLLALTLSQPAPVSEFHVTPHYCLRQLGVIDQHNRRGGRQYQQFAQSLERLSTVSYQNDGFYDPIRREHRRVLGKSSNLSGIDPETGEVIQLFNPRTQNWHEHFNFVGAMIVGRTPCGRATVDVLNMNEVERMRLRYYLIQNGELE